ncbi:cupredoxin domain-containing protein [Zooshikella harenae]|uniref:Cupredoxin domain-containing protein n=1 Tax=Zooshikella harenae TaxID=2827238 RepID=A0ABS5ZH03_9GAMM|nr:cupredoxin domain-containing protein [Zooshikella harenae]MBU2713351.1 cupredoxin domain-containing protein [Zooshikella harenae]
MLLVNVLGIGLIGLIIWWFWLYKPTKATMDNSKSIIIVDNGVYEPANIKLKENQPTILRFLRKDASPCAEMVLFPELDISEILPLNKTVEISLPALKVGEYSFHCQMQMYRGVLVVE